MGFESAEPRIPIQEVRADHTTFRQTYVRGSDDAAVIGTITYPGWGSAHFILVMEGPDAVAAYYETLPPRIGDHIKLVQNTTQT